MHVMIIGAAGMIGRKLVEKLVTDPNALGRDLSHLTLVDVIAAAAPSTLASTVTVANLAETDVAAKLVATRPDVIFHLAAVVSGEAEADFEKGYAVNLDGTRNLFEAIRLEGAREPYCPRLVFASSTAVFGSPFPDAIGDEFLTAPLTSYGTQKAIAELLLSDYSRRGVFDGIGLRLPTICIRPGAPNKAASGFFSGILREPLNGEEAVLPVEESVRHWFASPRAAVGFFLHAARMDLAAVGARRNLTMPGLSATVADQIDALRRVAGEKAVRLIRRQPDPVIARIVAGWPMGFQADRAREFGFRAESSFDDIIRIYLGDERGGRAP
jgi:nucleoside-diphosphate-sugar epimerase